MDATNYIVSLIEGQIASCIELVDDKRSKPASVVHEVRKSMKRCRAFLYLVKPGLKQSYYLKLRIKQFKHLLLIHF